MITGYNSRSKHIAWHIVTYGSDIHIYGIQKVGRERVYIAFSLLLKYSLKCFLKFIRFRLTFNTLDLNDLGRGSVNFFKKYIFKISASS